MNQGERRSPLQPLSACRVEGVDGVELRGERDVGADRRQHALVQQARRWRCRPPTSAMICTCAPSARPARPCGEAVGGIADGKMLRPDADQDRLAVGAGQLRRQLDLGAAVDDRRAPVAVRC